jgi:hypothetical protein
MRRKSERQIFVELQGAAYAPRPDDPPNPRQTWLPGLRTFVACFLLHPVRTPAAPGAMRKNKEEA